MSLVSIQCSSFSTNIMLSSYLLLFLLFPLHIVLCDVRGQLLLRIACYRHQSNMKLDKDGAGTACDTDNDCDPQFRFCLSNRPSPAHNCELERLPPFLFDDSQQLGECAKPIPEKNFPSVIKLTVSTNSSRLFLTVDLDDVDQSHFAMRSDEIDRLRFDLFPGLPSIPYNETISDNDYSELNISARSFHGDQRPYFRILGLLQCAPNRYGNRCDSFCQPTHQYKCSSNGSRVCKHGWRGKTCSVRDGCATNPCKTWAKCRPVDASFECECNGRTGQQCVKGTDPCLNHLCVNGASCFGSDTKPICNCKSGWTGELCNLRDPCLSNPCHSNGRCIKKINNESTAVTSFCQCNIGYEGKFCNFTATTSLSITVENLTQKTLSATERSFMDDSTSVIIMCSVISGLVVLGIIGILFFCMFRRRHEKKANQSDRLSKTPMLETRCSVPPAIHREQGNIYDEPGRIYSIGENSDEEREESDPYVKRGDVLLSQQDPRCAGPPALPQRQSSNVSNVSSPQRSVRFVRSHL